jgi:hypothetical protein
MLGRGLGGRLVRGGKQVVRAAAPGVAAALGTLILPGVSQATPAVTNCVPGPGGGEDCSGTGGSTPGTAAPLSPGTTEVDIPAFDGNEFFSFAIPAAEADVGIQVGLSGSDAKLNAQLVITAGDELNERLFIPLINVQPGASSATLTQTTGAATIFGSSGGSPTITGVGGNFPLPSGNVLSYAGILLQQAAGNVTVLGGGPSTVFAGGAPVTIGSAGSSSTVAGGGSATVGGSPTIFGTGDVHTLSGGFVFTGDPPADDVIFGIDLDGAVGGGVIFFSDPVNAPSSVPEPGTLSLLATALAGLVWRRRRRS